MQDRKREREGGGEREKESGTIQSETGSRIPRPRFRAERYILKQSPVRCALLIYNAAGCCLS